MCVHGHMKNWEQHSVWLESHPVAKGKPKWKANLQKWWFANTRKMTKPSSFAFQNLDKTYREKLKIDMYTHIGHMSELANFLLENQHALKYDPPKWVIQADFLGAILKVNRHFFGNGHLKFAKFESAITYMRRTITSTKFHLFNLIYEFCRFASSKVRVFALLKLQRKMLLETMLGGSNSIDGIPTRNSIDGISMRNSIEGILMRNFINKISTRNSIDEILTRNSTDEIPTRNYVDKIPMRNSRKVQTSSQFSAKSLSTWGNSWWKHLELFPLVKSAF